MCNKIKCTKCPLNVSLKLYTKSHWTKVHCALTLSLKLAYLDFSIFNLGLRIWLRCRALTRSTPALGGPFLAPQKNKK